MSDAADTSMPALKLDVVRPAAGSPVSSGQTLSGIGWLSCSVRVDSLHAGMAGPLAPVRLGLTTAEFETLTGKPPPAVPSGTATTSGFVFTIRVPPTPPGPAAILFEIRTERGLLSAEYPIRIRAANPEQLPTQPGTGTAPTAFVERAVVSTQMILDVSGWAIAAAGINRILVSIGSREPEEAQYGLSRTDVAAAHPESLEAVRSGFSFRREIADAEAESGTIYVTAVGKDDRRTTLSAALTLPVARRRRPLEDMAELLCEEMHLGVDGGLAVKGWAVASMPIKAITVILDEAVVGTVLPEEDRPDISNHHPRIASARRAGFRFVRAIGQAFVGQHVLELTLEREDGRTVTRSHIIAAEPGLPAHFAALLAPKTATRQRPAAPGEPAIRYFLDAPTVHDGVAVEPVRGFMSMSGWAVARGKITRIEVFVDGVSLGRVHHGIRREDVSSALPGYNGLLSGFAMMIPPQAMRPGLHQIRIAFEDDGGTVEEVGFAVKAERSTSGAGPWAVRRRIPQSEVALLADILAANGGPPGWCIVIPCGNDDTAELATTLRSLCDQALTTWNAIVLTQLAHATAVEAAVARVGPDLAGRVQVAQPMSDSLLAGLATRAELMAVLTPGDQLGEDALLEMSVEAALQPTADLLYSDEVRIDTADGEQKAFFKPDWSPELLLSMNYIGRLWAARPALVEAAGLAQEECLAGAEYDTVLRLSERAARVHHVPKVLCVSVRRTDARASERRALRAAARRRGKAEKVEPWLINGTWRLRRKVEPDAFVSIIIPTIAARGLIETAIGSIRKHTRWPHYEIVCLDNLPRNGTPDQQRWKAWIAANADRTVEIASRFNWSRFNNRGVKAARGDYLLFLNDDVEVLDGDWLHTLMEQAQRPEIGVVGPQLLYSDGRVQHAGMFLAQRAARHAFRHYPRDEPGAFGLARTQRNVISVTGACMLMRRTVFDAVGGFDERHAVINNDLDFNMRVRRAGYDVIFTPFTTLVHHEMATRADIKDVFDSVAFTNAWGDVFLKGDPYFSPHFSTDCDDFLPDAEPVRQFTVGHPLVAKDALRRILAVKVDHIGDFITAFPAFRRIKHHFPGAHLTVLAPAASVALAAMEPAIDRVIEFNFFHARSEKGLRAGTQKTLHALQAQLAPERFDLALDLRRQSDTREILRHTGARWLGGFDRGYAHPWLDFSVEFEGDFANHLKRDHVVDSLLRLIDGVAANCQSDRHLFAIRPDRAAAREALDARLAALGLPAERLSTPLACLHTGAGSLNKQWPSLSFAGLIDLLAGEAAAGVMIIGGAEEAAFVASLLKAVRHSGTVINLVGKVPLRELPGVIAAADLYIGNDSGPKHIAAALGVPTIGIHSGSVDAGEWGPMGSNALTIRRDVKCGPCYIARVADCHRGLACLTGIRVGDVWRACRRMLALSGR